MRLLASVFAVLAVVMLVPAGAAFEARPVDARAFALCAESAAWLRGFPVPERPSAPRWTAAAWSGELYGLAALGTTGVVVERAAASSGFRAVAASTGSERFREVAAGATACWTPDGPTWIVVAGRALGLAAREAGEAWTGAIDAGVCRVVAGRLAVGLMVRNVGGSRLLSSPLPTVHALSWRLALERMVWVGGVELEAGFEPSVCAGCELRVLDHLVGRVGLGFDPGRVGGGLGFEVASVGLDLGWQWHPRLGASVRVSLRKSF